MPPIERHVAISLERTGQEFREVHEWIDAPEHKLAHHDLSRVAEFAREITALFGPEAADEYTRHLQEDVKMRFTMIAGDTGEKLAETLAFFGCKP
ncbi:MAG: hypothetical protein H7841_06995 [Magnetospirillum sp. WYHS-4]